MSLQKQLEFLENLNMDEFEEQHMYDERGQIINLERDSDDT